MLSTNRGIKLLICCTQASIYTVIGNAQLLTSHFCCFLCYCCCGDDVQKKMRGEDPVREARLKHEREERDREKEKERHERDVVTQRREHRDDDHHNAVDTSSSHRSRSHGHHKDSRSRSRERSDIISFSR